MGKKRKIISKPQKFGRKHSSHPLAKATIQAEEPAVKPEPKPVVEEVKPEPKPEPEPKKIEVKKEEPRRRRARKTPPVSKKTKPAKE